VVKEIKGTDDLIDRVLALLALEDVDFSLKVIIDLGISIYIVNNKKYFKVLRELATAKYIELARGTRTPL